MEWLQTNWWWVLIGLGVAWLLFRSRGHGMGCGGRRNAAQAARRVLLARTIHERVARM
jgi:hypothetical protein